MVQYAESLHKLQELLKKEANEWTPGRLVISIATSLTNDNQIELDFSPTIGHRKNKPRNPSDDNCHWLPAHNTSVAVFRESFASEDQERTITGSQLLPANHLLVSTVVVLLAMI